jgi:alkylation response protein AidB-like acyl-CoA dehydrogenase
VMSKLTQERLSCAIASVAHAEESLSMTFDYVRNRHVFGQSVGSFQHNRFQLAELRTLLDVARCWVDCCLNDHVKSVLSEADAAKAKLWATEVQNRVIDVCVQLHGGYGYMEEFSVARAWADARVTRIFAGTSEIMREIVARSLPI